MIQSIFSPAVAYADTICKLNGQIVPCNTGVFPYFVQIFFVGFVLMIFLFVFWIRMIIDVAKRDIPNKTTWVLIIVLLNWLGSLIYYFQVKRPATKKEKLPAQKPVSGTTNK